MVVPWFDDEHGMGSNLSEPKFDSFFLIIGVTWIWKGGENLAEGAAKGLKNYQVMAFE